MSARWSSLLALTLLISVGCATSDSQRGRSADIRSQLVGGTWARHLDEKIFFADGTFEAHDREHDKPTFGRWQLDGATLTMTERGETTTCRIISISATDLHMTFADGTDGLHYKR